MAGALGYNERKVSRDEATIILKANMDTDRDNCVKETFERYEKMNYRSKEVCFHMSVNPGPGEAMDDGMAIQFISELMDRLGYGAQPYVIYRHNDIEREHFHVLSTRINNRGHKVRDFWEHRNCQKTLRDICEKYGYTVGSREEAAQIVRSEDEFLCFNPGYGNVSQQMNAIFEECMSYHYTSRRQFDLISRDHGLRMRIAAGKMSFQGTDFEGKKCTVPYSEPQYLARYLDRMQECNSEKIPQEDLQRVSDTGKRLLPLSRSEYEFTKMMLSQNIHPVFDKDSSGKITGVTFIDHESRTAIGGSALGHEFTLADIQQAQRDQWESSSEHHSLNIGELLIAFGNNSKSKEKDPKYRKRKRGVHM